MLARTIAKRKEEQKDVNERKQKLRTFQSRKSNISDIGKRTSLKSRSHSIIFYCEDNPQLRPPICGIIFFSLVTVSGFILFYFYYKDFFVLTLAIILSGFVAFCASFVWFCYKRRTLLHARLVRSAAESKESLNYNIFDIDDPLMHKATTHIKYRCCEDVWETKSALLQIKMNQNTTKLLPTRRYKLHVTPSPFYRDVFNELP